MSPCWWSSWFIEVGEEQRDASRDIDEANYRDPWSPGQGVQKTIREPQKVPELHCWCASGRWSRKGWRTSRREGKQTQGDEIHVLETAGERPAGRQGHKDRHEGNWPGVWGDWRREGLGAPGLNVRLPAPFHALIPLITGMGDALMSLWLGFTAAAKTQPWEPLGRT